LPSRSKLRIGSGLFPFEEGLGLSSFFRAAPELIPPTEFFLPFQND